CAGGGPTRAVPTATTPSSSASRRAPERPGSPFKNRLCRLPLAFALALWYALIKMARARSVRPEQLRLPAGSTWGGWRKGAGRKAGEGLRPVPHRVRASHRAAHPVHVTLRVVPLPSLREQVIFAAIRRALGAASSEAFRVVHFSVQ